MISRDFDVVIISKAEGYSVGRCRLALEVAALVGMVMVCGCASDPASIAARLPPPPSISLTPSPIRSGPARTVYVDPSLAAASCERYDPATRSCGGAEAIAYRELTAAAETALPGDTVLIRGGSFRTPLVPAHSGAPGAPITFRAHPGETVMLTGIDRPAILLQRRAHVVIQGLTVAGVLGWGRLEDAAHIVIRDSRFSEAQARGTTGGLKLVRSHYNRIVDNSFERGNDSVVIQDSDRNLIAGNVFTWARHSLLSIRCGNFNVIRGNRFHNKRQKAAEIYDCQGVSDAPVKFDATKRNFVEDNVFAFTRGPSQPHKYNGIQYAGQLGVVRRNVFFNNKGGAIHLAVYPPEALDTYGHRIYHNTFYANLCYGLSDAGATDTVVVNNIFYRNGDCHGDAVQTAADVDLRRNAVLPSDQDPKFVSEDARDLRLRPESPLADAGAFLTQTVGLGAGITMMVADVSYFYDGHGIEAEVGDLVQLAGGTERARILAIDFASRSLTLDRAMTWQDGQGVTLAYEGHSPDPGAFELGR